MGTATLILLGAVIAAQTYAMPEPADSTGGSGPTVTVQRGVAWFYGHRFEAPFTLGYSDDGLAIDGYFLPREIRPASKHSPTHGDTLRSQLSARTLEILREARRNHVPREAAFARVEQAYLSSAIVKRAELRGYSLRITYKDRPGRDSVVLVDPEDVALEMTSEDLAEKQREIQWKQLLQLKDHFESVGLVVWFDRLGYTLLPNDHSSRVDALLHRLQQGTKITNEDRAFLQATVPTNFRDLSRMTQRPRRLMAATSPED